MNSDQPPNSLHVSLSNVTEPSRESQNRPNDRGDQRSTKMLPHCYPESNCLGSAILYIIPIGPFMTSLAVFFCSSLRTA